MEREAVRNMNMTSLKENYNHFLGSMVADPFEGERSSTGIDIETGVFVPNDPPGVYAVHNMAHYQGAVLSVHFLKENEWSTLEGSAVLIAPGVAFAAAHVVEPLIPFILASELRVFCAGYTPSGPRYWRVHEIHKIDNSDLMLLALKYASPLPSDGRFVQMRITTRLPQMGELVMIAGWRASRERVEADSAMAFPVVADHIKYGAGLRMAVGEVTQHHLNGRLPGLTNPVIEVACSTPGGLSGGPAFDKDGRVFGILSYSVDDPDGRGPSQISLIWPALAQPIRPAFLERSLPERFRLLDLDDSLCGIDGRDRLSFIDNGDGQLRLVWEAVRAPESTQRAATL
jgi:hypothetical protein